MKLNPILKDRYTLNIGLDNLPVEAGSTVSSKSLFVARALRAAGFRAYGGKVLNSDTEPTLVVEANYRSLYGARSAAYDVAVACAQDCIAIYDNEVGEGKLMGPRADNWGEFNPDFFITIDGSRLGVVE